MADQQDVVVLSREPPRLVVHLGHQRAGRVDGAQPADLRVAADLGGDAMRGEHHDCAGRHLVYFRHEDGATPLKRADDMGIVYDLSAYIDRGAELVHRQLDRLYSAVDPGALAARLGEQNPALARRHESMVGEYVLVLAMPTPRHVAGIATHRRRREDNPSGNTR